MAARLELDSEAVSILGRPLEQGIQVDDLREAGWTVTAPPGAGGRVLEVQKRFSSPRDLARLMEELAGPAGPLSGFRLDRERSFNRIDYRLRGSVELSEAAAATGFDNAPGLAERLADAGVDAERVAQLLASRAEDGVRLSVVVDLPGAEARRWEVAVGERREVAVTSSVTDWVRPALLAVAGALALVAVAVASTGRRRSPSPDA